MPNVAKKTMHSHLLTRYQEGDKTAFQKLFGRYEKTLYALLRRYLGRHDLVEDVLQETFFQLYVSRSQYDARRSSRLRFYLLAWPL